MKLTESQLNAFLGFLIQRINLDLSFGKTLEEQDIEPLINSISSMTGLQLEEADFKKIKVEIEYRYKIKHTTSSCIFNDYDEARDWYSNFTPTEEFFWNRYRNHLINNEHLDINSVNKLESETLVNLMNCIGNPNDKIEGKRLRRGLVIGDVQSGKTATYAGLICKAADAGYKVVVLLTGITESLRKQTQERMEEGIIGCTVRVDKKGHVGKKIIRVGVGLDNKDIRATAFTSYEDDFRGNVDNIVTSLDSHRSLVIFIVKKNVSVLTKLYNWLVEQNKDVLDDLIHEPMLLIDDEADNASINTKKDKLNPTMTNRMIRQLCESFNNATYVGFTATPFANVFIDPDTTEGMENEDLFPTHFIYVLPTPSTYIGATKIFDENGCYNDWVKYIIDIFEPDIEDIKEMTPSELTEGPFYFKHPKEWHGILPKSLDDAVYSFLLGNVVRDLRGDYTQPRTMMVNMSRFVKVQKYIKTYIEDLYKNIFDVVNIDFSNDDLQNSKLEVYQNFRRVWFENYAHLNFDIKEVLAKPTLLKAIEKIQIVVVNSAKDSAKLDYKTNPSLRLIAIGGLALSRGLTLKGLMTSYFYRNTATFDVLLQMGRWFGYRHGYDDICQIWTSKSSAKWYEEISRSTEELKDDIQRMYYDRLTPKEFGIRVRNESDDLQITASNKMRNSFSKEEFFTFWGGVFETPYSSRALNQNTNNLKVVKELVSALAMNGYKFQKNLNSRSQTKVAYNVPCDFVRNLLDKIEVSISNPKFDPRMILSFLDEEKCEQLATWDIALQGGSGDLMFNITESVSIQTAKRDIFLSNGHICFSGRGTLGGNNDGQIGLDLTTIENIRKAFEAEGGNKGKALPNVAWYKFAPNRKPLLTIYFIRPAVNLKKEHKEGQEKALTEYKLNLGNDPIICFSVGFPANPSREIKTKKYKVNKTYMRQLLEAVGEEDDDL